MEQLPQKVLEKRQAQSSAGKKASEKQALQELSPGGMFVAQILEALKSELSSASIPHGGAHP